MDSFHKLLEIIYLENRSKKLCDTPLMSKSKLQLKTPVTYKVHVNQTKNTSVLSSYFHVVS